VRELGKMEYEMNKKVILGLATALGMAISTPVLADPITTQPPPLIATGDVVAYYVFADAANTSQLSEPSAGIAPFFCNHAPLCATENTAGDSVDLGVQSGPMEFQLDNLTFGKTYFSDLADSDGNFHVLITSNYDDFGVGPEPAGIPAGVIFVGWEDKNLAEGSDFDYNDLIFAFTNTNSSVPEPLTLSLFGAGLLGVASLRRRRKTA